MLSEYYPSVVLDVTSRCGWQETESEECGASTSLVATLASCPHRPSHGSVDHCPDPVLDEASLCDLHGAKIRQVGWLGLRRLRSITTPPPSKENPHGD